MPIAILRGHSNQNNQKIIVVSHSWGTVLAYTALSFINKEIGQSPSDLLITLSSPLGTPYAHNDLYLIEATITDYVGSQLNSMNFNECTNCIPSDKTINYWAWRDVISGPFESFAYNSKDIQVDFDYDESRDQL